MKVKIVTGLFVLWVGLYGLFGCKVDVSKTTIVNDKSSRSEYVEDEIIVKFKEGVSLQKIEEINKALGTEIMKVFSSGKIFLLRIPKGGTVPVMIEKYKRLPEVEYGEPNYIIRNKESVW